jgi:hypothetical protein
VSCFSFELRLYLMSSPVDPRGSGLRRTSTKSKHMKPITKLGAALIAGAILTLTPVCPAQGAGASREWEYGILSVDIPGFEVPCLNETLRIVADWPVRWHQVWTPSGGYSYRFQFTPSTPANGGYYILIGETTGKIYYSQTGMPANEAFHLGPGEVYSFRSHERYVAEDGERLTIDWHFQFTADANGEVVVDMAVFKCRVR